MSYLLVVSSNHVDLQPLITSSSVGLAHTFYAHDLAIAEQIRRFHGYPRTAVIDWHHPAAYEISNMLKYEFRAGGCTIIACGPRDICRSVIQKWATLFLVYEPRMQVAQQKLEQRKIAGFVFDYAQVIQMIAAGMSHSSIARHLMLSESGVKSRLRKLFNELGVNDRAALVLRAMRLGIIP